MTVERELEKVLHKFSGYGQLCERGLEELIDYTGGLKHGSCRATVRRLGWSRGTEPTTPTPPGPGGARRCLREAKPGLPRGAEIPRPL